MTDPAVDLSPSELQRYARHLILPQVGQDGQERLKAARVLLIGAGGLGSPAALYLAAAGIGTIGMVDRDQVDLSNLQRQILHGESDLGKQKVVSAAGRLREINPHVELELHETFLDESNGLDLIGRYDIVVDGTDNFATRYLVNDACVLTGVPNAYGSIFRFEGQASLFAAEDGPCYRCLHPAPPPAGLVPNCAEGGVFGVLPGVIGTLQATEVLKYILDIGTSLKGRLLLYDALQASVRTLALKRNPSCPVCGHKPTITTLTRDAVSCPSDPVSSMQEITVQQLAKELAEVDSAPVLLDVREGFERAVSAIEPSLHIPLGQLPERLDQVPAGNLVVYCKVGARSARAIEFLERQGLTGMRNLAGGISAWARDIDPSMEVV